MGHARQPEGGPKIQQAIYDMGAEWALLGASSASYWKGAQSYNEWRDATTPTATTTANATTATAASPTT